MAEYPFVPRSTRDLEPGQFWAVPLKDGRFAFGRVLQVGGDMIPTPSRGFFGGLHAWTGMEKPTEASIAGSALLHVGVMHIRAIVSLGGEILGCRSLALDSIAAPILLSAMGGPGTMVLQGATSVRPAKLEEWGRFPVLGYWGWDFIQALANKEFTDL